MECVSSFQTKLSSFFISKVCFTLLVIIIIIIILFYLTIIIKLYYYYFRFPEDVRENLNKILHLQSLLKKEHEKCVKMFESNAFVSVEFLFCSSSIMPL